jgi:soluble lytic murein transglycosylase-like protein
VGVQLIETVATLLLNLMPCLPVRQDLAQEAATNLNMRTLTCMAVVGEARRSAVPVGVGRGVAWVESRFDMSAVGSSGELGPLQALPRYWCRQDPCDTVQAGVGALKHYLKRSRTVEGALGRFNGAGKRSKHVRRAMRAVNRYSQGVEL